MADARITIPVELTGLERPRVALAVLDELQHLEAADPAGRAGLDRRRLALFLKDIREELRAAQRSLDAGRELVGLKPLPGEAAAEAARPLAAKMVRTMRRSALESVLCRLRKVAGLAAAAMEAQDRQGVRTPTRREEAAQAAAVASGILQEVRGRVTGSAAVRARPSRRRRSS